MIFTNLNDKILLQNTLELVQNERRVTLEVLHHLREIERRSLYAVLGYPSLFEYAVKELRYSHSAAYRRIESMRLLKDVPEVEEKIKSVELSLSNLAQAQNFFKKENVKDKEDK